MTGDISDDNLCLMTESEDDDERNNSTNDSNGPSYKRKSPSWLLPVASLVASLGGVLFGYDVGIISDAMLLIKSDFDLNDFEQELIVTMLLIGGLFASLTGGFILDQYGRKFTIIINALIFLCGTSILTFSSSFAFFVVGRFVLGFAVALSAVGDCVYISEIAPPHKRGFLVSLNELGITFGILLAYLVGYFFINVTNGWRIMFGLSGIPALIQAISMFYLPASPRWLITKGKEEKAEELIKVIWPYLDSGVELRRLKVSLLKEKNYKFYELFTNRENLRLRMVIGCGVILFQQLTGQPTVLYYAPTLFQVLGFEGNKASILATVGLGIVKFIFTFITLMLVDRLGRRTFLLLGAVIITLSLIALTAVTQPISELNNYTPVNISQHVSTNTTIHDVSNKMNDSSQVIIKYVSLGALMLFVVGYAIGYGPMSWLVLTEIFPTGIKGRAVAIASSINWGTNIILSITFLNVLDGFGPFWTFFTYSLIAATSILFLSHFVPETKGKSLEEISGILDQRKTYCSRLRCCARGHVVFIDEENDWLLDDTDIALFNQESLL